MVLLQMPMQMKTQIEAIAIAKRKLVDLQELARMVQRLHLQDLRQLLSSLVLYLVWL